MISGLIREVTFGGGGGLFMRGTAVISSRGICTFSILKLFCEI